MTEKIVLCLASLYHIGSIQLDKTNNLMWRNEFYNKSSKGYTKSPHENITHKTQKNDIGT